MPLKALIVTLLAFFALSACISRFERANTADFYNYWGVSAARSWAPELAGPYAGNRGPNDGAQRYTEALAERAAGSGDPRLERTTHLRRKGMYLTSTPLLYASFGLLESAHQTYSGAWRTYFSLQVAAFSFAVFALVYGYSGAAFAGVVLALVLVIVFAPFRSDLDVGNLNSIQLALTTALVLWADSQGISRAKGRILFCLLVALGLFKPNLGLFVLAMTLYVIARYGLRDFVRSILPAGVGVGFLLVAASGWIFGSVSVWLDWFGKVFGPGSGRFAFPVETGNVSSVLLLSRDGEVSVAMAIFLLGAFLCVSAFLALGLGAARAGGGVAAVVRALGRAFEDPGLAASAGIVLSFALMPLAWFHYYVLMLLPGLWLALKPGHGRVAGYAGVLAVVLASGCIQPVFGPLLGVTGLHQYAMALSWVPAWLGVISVLGGGLAATRGEEAGQSSPGWTT